MNKVEVILYGFIIAIIIIAIWLAYAYYYRTSITRLSRLAGQRYMMITSNNIQSQYIVQCDPNQSTYDSASKTFNATITFTPDIQHPNAPKLPNVTKKYNVAFDSTACDPTNLLQYIECLNVNE